MTSIFLGGLVFHRRGCRINRVVRSRDSSRIADFLIDFPAWRRAGRRFLDSTAPATVDCGFSTVFLPRRRFQYRLLCFASRCDIRRAARDIALGVLTRHDCMRQHAARQCGASRESNILPRAAASDELPGSPSRLRCLVSSRWRGISSSSAWRDRPRRPARHDTTWTWSAIDGWTIHAGQLIDAIRLGGDGRHQDARRCARSGTGSAFSPHGLKLPCADRDDPAEMY